MNSSPTFLVNDTAVVCRNSFFQYSFQATDPDADSLSYSFCDAFAGGDAGSNSAPNPAAKIEPPILAFLDKHVRELDSTWQTRKSRYDRDTPAE